MNRLEGRVAFITGAARGQGRAHALTLAAEGADIVAVDIEDQVETVPYQTARREDLQETVRMVDELGRRALAVTADVRTQGELSDAVARSLDHFGRIDILLANAGILSLAPLHELTEDAWQTMIDINLGGVWRSLKAVVPTMMGQRSGSVVLTSSVNGVEGAAQFSHYVAAKHGVLGLMRAAALEYGRYNIRVNAVCPGFIDTDMNDGPHAWALSTGNPSGTRADHERAAHHWSALADRGALSPSSVSAAVLWLVSDDARDVTGQAVAVDGGHLLLPGVNGDPVFGVGNPSAYSPGGSGPL